MKPPDERCLSPSAQAAPLAERSPAASSRVQAAERAIGGITECYATGELDEEPESSPAVAAAHYTIAGFYTYHSKNDKLGEQRETLRKAQRHLEKALAIQVAILGHTHVSTLCTQLVKAQARLPPRPSAAARYPLDAHPRASPTAASLAHSLCPHAARPPSRSGGRLRRR